MPVIPSKKVKAHVYVHDAFAVNRNVGHCIAFFTQVLARLQDYGMLYARSDDVVAVLTIGMGSAYDRKRQA